MVAGDTLAVSVPRLSITETLERLAPGTPMRRALERVIQEDNGGLVVLGHNAKVAKVCSGGFKLNGAKAWCTFAGRANVLAVLDGKPALTPV